jgi:ribosome maturation factor RimP
VAKRKVGAKPTFLFPEVRETDKKMPTAEQSAILDRVSGLAERAAETTGIEVLDVQLKGSGKARLLRVYIDKPGGVTHGDCELISERFGALLDQEDAIPGDNYTLEVSSPGVERKLANQRDFERVVGQRIHLSLREPINDLRSVEGKLIAVAGQTIEVETASGDTVQVPLARLSKANLKFDW